MLQQFFPVWWLYLSLVLAGCILPQTRGAVAVKNAPPLQEARDCGTDSPLEIIARQSAELGKLREENQSLLANFTQSDAARSLAQGQLQQLAEEFQKLNDKFQKLSRELEEWQNKYQASEEAMVKLNIEKVRLEQELIQMKIERLQNENGK